MKGRLFLLAAAAALCTSCALPIMPAPTALDRIERGYQRLSASANLILPLLPDDREVRARALLASIGLAISAVRAATSDTDRAALIVQLDVQVAALARALRR